MNACVTVPLLMTHDAFYFICVISAKQKRYADL